MILKTTLAGRTYAFKDVKDVMAKANEQKSGDVLAGLAAETDSERIAAKEVLANMLMSDLREHPAVDYDIDDVTRMDQDGVDTAQYNRIKNMTVGEFREWLLSYDTTEADIKGATRGMTAEMVAGVAKIMSNLDLVYAAHKIHVESECNTVAGRRGTFSTRLQPNHPTDDVEGITASLYEGLSYGCGDMLIGLNPVNDTSASCKAILERFDDVKRRWQIPTQICVLAHITAQMEAVRQGAPTDLIFQSIAGSQKGNESFGFTTETIREAQALLREKGTAKGPNVMYFETGQGSELSSDSHFGADQVTMEARCYAYAKQFQPFMVNTVVGFIGPEYLYDSKQVMRAGLEDHFMAKLSGIPMGCDCCYTNHMMADQNDLETLTLSLAAAGCNYVIGVPATDDVMLNYQSNAYHDAAAVREVLGLHPIAEFERWCERVGIMADGKLTERAGDPSIFTERSGL
ncbi:ethanolamine ammonia-lyase subunit EutB [Collinsella ihumii]|uniref:Ethanolamine ammonia-lyase large subunit n=1 Tax=Collinsella ihumii TaxID=1720204 RepID=A0AAW7JRV8_9ACTN|nr:ethanolamine ammonia-lyase subunit EutB [Collinsella ihumii]MBM6687584.1 ethanolamine ammonia-lyase subunit EutB [Collinsella tanakaei]MBM6777803.1 ethanolamine ammonia-lyase subunit EutB [Collinsella tanakaei]MDN0070099.1 ethanolamine ammonia-lyase subunit EutB [Collinsella ihumii]